MDELQLLRSNRRDRRVPLRGDLPLPKAVRSIKEYGQPLREVACML